MVAHHLDQQAAQRPVSRDLKQTLCRQVQIRDLQALIKDDQGIAEGIQRSG